MGMVFDPKTHVYSLTDRPKGLPSRPVPSVTSVLFTSGLVDVSWCGGVEYLDRGTLVHGFTAKMDMGEKTNLNWVPKKWRGFIRAWTKFRLETGFTPDLTEHRVYSCQYLLDKDPAHFCNICYAGTMDRLGRFTPDDRIPTVLDIKNANSGRAKGSVKYQLVAYGHALDPKKLFHRVAVSLHSDVTYAMSHFGIDTWNKDLDVFLQATRDTHRSRQWAKFLSGGR